MARVNQPRRAVVPRSCLQPYVTHLRLSVGTAVAAVKLSASVCVKQPAKAADGSFRSLRFFPDPDLRILHAVVSQQRGYLSIITIMLH